MIATHSDNLLSSSKKLNHRPPPTTPPAPSSSGDGPPRRTVRGGPGGQSARSSFKQPQRAPRTRSKQAVQNSVWPPRLAPPSSLFSLLLSALPRRRPAALAARWHRPPCGVVRPLARSSPPASAATARRTQKRTHCYYVWCVVWWGRGLGGGGFFLLVFA